MPTSRESSKVVCPLTDDALVTTPSTVTMSGWCLDGGAARDLQAEVALALAPPAVAALFARRLDRAVLGTPPDRRVSTRAAPGTQTPPRPRPALTHDRTQTHGRTRVASKEPCPRTRTTQQQTPVVGRGSMNVATAHHVELACATARATRAASSKLSDLLSGHERGHAASLVPGEGARLTAQRRATHCRRRQPIAPSSRKVCASAYRRPPPSSRRCPFEPLLLPWAETFLLLLRTNAPPAAAKPPHLFRVPLT